MWMLKGKKQRTRGGQRRHLVEGLEVREVRHSGARLPHVRELVEQVGQQHTELRAPVADVVHALRLVPDERE